MTKTLLILPFQIKEEAGIKEHLNSIKEYFGENSKEFYYDYTNLMALKKAVIENDYKNIIIGFPSFKTGFGQLQMIKSLSVKSRLIIYCPDMDFIKMADDMLKGNNENNDLMNWYISGQAIQLNVYRQADLIITGSKENKEFLKAKLSGPVIINIEELKTSGFAEFSVKDKKISIIVLTFNQRKLTKQFIESLQKHTSVKYELIFVDNGSTDNTKEYFEQLQQTNNNVKYIYNINNIGYAKANNQGIRSSSGDYVVLLNNDVILTDGWLERLIACAESDPFAGVVAPCTNKAVGQQVVNYNIGKKESEIQLFASLLAMKNAGKWFEVHRVIGFCMLIKKEVLQKIGMLDERFGPGGFEDYDFCLRVKQAGYKIMVASDIFIYHIGGKGYSDNNLDYDRLRQNNVTIFIEKWVKKTLENMEKMPDNP